MLYRLSYTGLTGGDDRTRTYEPRGSGFTVRRSCRCATSPVCQTRPQSPRISWRLVFERMNSKTCLRIVSTKGFIYTRPGVSLCWSMPILRMCSTCDEREFSQPPGIWRGCTLEGRSIALGTAGRTFLGRPFERRSSLPFWSVSLTSRPYPGSIPGVRQQKARIRQGNRAFKLYGASDRNRRELSLAPSAAGRRPLRATLENASAFPQLRTRIRVRFLAFGSKKPGSVKGTGPSSSMEPATGIEPATH